MKGRAACSKSFPSTRSIFRQPNSLHDETVTENARQRASMAMVSPSTLQNVS